jgi:hypothetical protein
MTTKRTKTKDSVAAGNIYPAIPPALARTEFLNRVGKTKEEQNSYVEKFLSSVETVCALKQSWTLSDLIYCTQPFCIPAQETKALFEKWCEVMLGLRKITMIEGCYSEPLVCLV